ncbi:MAG: hypothetical protein JO332_10310 [Planctomycetaceae bacterium]|nr:hypothetical protein [Planctomycetaceae bacterium]
MHGILDNLYFQMFAAWPGILLLCALFSMLCQWSFSWSELILDYLAGMVIGLCFYLGTEKKAPEAAQFFLIFSQGLPGVLHVAGVKALQARDTLFFVSSAWVGGAVVLASLLDLATRKIGLSMSAGNGALSILIALLKLPFSLCTTAVGLLFFLAGLFWFIVKKAQDDGKDPAKRCYVGLGFMGGVPYVEWNTNVSPGNYSATTIGAMFNVWYGRASDVVKHELYHTRQYMYFHDWMIPFWLLGGLWGMISAALANATKAATEKEVPVLRSFHTAQQAKEVGNPMERAAYMAGNV